MLRCRKGLLAAETLAELAANGISSRGRRRMPRDRKRGGGKAGPEHP